MTPDNHSLLHLIWAGAHNLGEGMTFVFVAWLVNYFGWRAGFVGPGLCCTVVAFVLYFWIGASVLSLLLAAMAWNVKPRE